MIILSAQTALFYFKFILRSFHIPKLQSLKYSSLEIFLLAYILIVSFYHIHRCKINKSSSKMILKGIIYFYVAFRSKITQQNSHN